MSMGRFMSMNNKNKSIKIIFTLVITPKTYLPITRGLLVVDIDFRGEKLHA